ncbi:hypothetical protein LU290_02885 [Moraxella nasibovis]|uniref:hypothetical protein n=1 Tax=Moraxella nasibovis TaxID=2904120 RepID=UPI0024109FCB|nr:hypothetical protein [Moraxella nasibovis]WFF39187.1 hypothetical protein LU290_02885 [Moraxella nasibovis]
MMFLQRQMHKIRYKIRIIHSLVRLNDPIEILRHPDFDKIPLWLFALVKVYYIFKLYYVKISGRMQIIWYKIKGAFLITWYKIKEAFLITWYKIKKKFLK